MTSADVEQLQYVRDQVPPGISRTVTTRAAVNGARPGVAATR